MANGVRITIYARQVLAEARRLSTEPRARIAHQIATDARAAAPVVTGEYRDGIGAEVSGDEVRVVDNDDTSPYKEYGTSDTPPHATLTNAARAYGRYSGWQPR